MMHAHGVSVNGVTWTEGTNAEVHKHMRLWTSDIPHALTNAEVHKRMWDIGFDHFTSDYPEFFAEFVKTIQH
jgi:hypothetical protein